MGGAPPYLEATPKANPKLFLARDKKRYSEHFISRCSLTCARRSGKHHTQNLPLQSLARPGLFETVTLDMVDPFELKDRKYWLLTIIDHLSKWAEVDILQRTTAGDIAKSFITVRTSRYGVPQRVLKDRETNFMAAFNHNIQKLLGTTYIKTSPHHPQGNGVSEAFIQ